MKNSWWKIAVVAVIVISVALIVSAKNKGVEHGTSPVVTTATSPSGDNEQGEKDEAQEAANHTPAAETNGSEEGEVARPEQQPAPSVEKHESKAAVSTSVSASEVKPEPKPAAAARLQKKLPRIVDLEADKCVPCKMMAPILDELRKEYKAKLTVEFIDVWKDRSAGDGYGISSIPTQVFYDENGKEFSRHVGFMSKEDILATFEKKGISLKD